MFQVHRYDPRKEDAKEKADKKKKARRINKTSNAEGEGRKNSHILSSSEEAVSIGIRRKHRKENSALLQKKKHKSVDHDQIDKDNDQHQEIGSSSLSLPRFSGSFPIAPETDGSLTAEKLMKNKLTAEAFEDLDLEDDAWNDDKSYLQDGTEVDPTLDNDLENDFDPTDEIQRALYMSTLPITQAARKWGLADFLVKNLHRDGLKHFFPIQALVIPDVIMSEKTMGTIQSRDVLVSAATGSGKTLAFVCPILNSLATCKIRRLRALVILPSRDLAMQVYNVFERYREGSSLQIGLAIGQTDFQQEQNELIFGGSQSSGGERPSRKKYSYQDKFIVPLRHSMDPGNLEFALDAMAQNVTTIGDCKDRVKNDCEVPAGGISAIDILVCTPGRLVDHLDNTPGFTYALQHLQYLVIDEADRLLSQPYHGWIQRVFDSIYAQPPIIEINDADCWKSIAPVTYHRSVQKSSSFLSSTGRSLCQRIQLRKLLYSATLTKDPQKLASLKLVNPKYFNAHQLHRKSAKNENIEKSLYRMPDQLQESTVECTAEQKPLVLLALLLERIQPLAFFNESYGNAKNLIVVFTASLESTHRLTRLLQLLWQTAGTGEPPKEYSSALNQHQRSQLMRRCNDPNDRSVRILVCSDGMSRGMDLSSVRTVIHYDVPSLARTYVHRCGRTARAGQDGHAIALLKGKGQMGQFKRLRRLIADPDRVQKATVNVSLVRDAVGVYKTCLSSLKDVLNAEARQELQATDTDLTQWLPSRHEDEESESEYQSVSGDNDSEITSSSTSTRS